MKKRIQELVKILNEAAHSYYVEDKEIMSNYEYDKLYDELLELERTSGIVFPDSPTQSAGAGYESVSKLKKEKHKYPALSLDKTKNREELVKWLNGKKGVLSWKMDGLTVVATYNNGRLISAVTRGDGYEGEVVTHNAKHFSGLPNKIPYDGELIVRGEAVMNYADFERINDEIEDVEAKYKNARNLASATVRLLDSKESAKRPITFTAFDRVYCQDDCNSKYEQLQWLKKCGFNVVENVVVTPESVIQSIADFEKRLPDNPFPSDGLVLIFDDEKYGLSLGMTGKFPRNGIAFKWKDETVLTKITSIEWLASRTGLLNPVAVFEPVELEGTTVSRASVHNLSIAKSLKLGIGSEVNVFKANKIIPQIAETVVSTGETIIPKVCPICGKPTSVKNADGIETLYCGNLQCPAKNIGRFVHFCERGSMNMVGMSESTIKKFVETGIIKEYSDFFTLAKHPEIKKMDGFGEKSFQNMIDSADFALKNADFVSVVNAFGIPNIGTGQAKLLKKAVEKWSYEMYPDCQMTYFDSLSRMTDCFDFSSIDGFGPIIAKSLSDWIDENMVKDTEVMRFLSILPTLWIPEKKETRTSQITGKTFVITGSVVHYKNREELKSYIESLGGRVSNSVSSKTDFLINNDISSTSGKNKKAKELGIPIITEENFLAMV